jgi:hypothetical protein
VMRFAAKAETERLSPDAPCGALQCSSVQAHKLPRLVPVLLLLSASALLVSAKSRETQTLDRADRAQHRSVTSTRELEMAEAEFVRMEQGRGVPSILFSFSFAFRVL